MTTKTRDELIKELESLSERAEPQEPVWHYDYLDESKVADFIINREQSIRAELETERLRLAGCGVAALGYFDGCKEEYKSASLNDVLELRKKHDELKEMNVKAWETNIKLNEKISNQQEEIRKVNQQLGECWVKISEARKVLEEINMRGVSEQAEKAIDKTLEVLK